MGQLFLVTVVALAVAAVVFGVAVLVTNRDPGLVPAEPAGRSVPLPGNRPLAESDVTNVRFDTAIRGYRMAQVDQALRRAAYDIGYKDELITVLEAEVIALREGRTADADVLRGAREAALGPADNDAGQSSPEQPDPAHPDRAEATRGEQPERAGSGGAGDRRDESTGRVDSSEAERNSSEAEPGRPEAGKPNGTAASGSPAGAEEALQSVPGGDAAANTVTDTEDSADARPVRRTGDRGAAV